MPPSNAFKPAAAWYPPLRLWFGFALYERKTEPPKERQYRSAEGWIADCVSRVSYKRDQLQKYELALSEFHVLLSSV